MSRPPLHINILSVRVFFKVWAGARDRCHHQSAIVDITDYLRS